MYLFIIYLCHSLYILSVYSSGFTHNTVWSFSIGSAIFLSNSAIYTLAITSKYPLSSKWITKNELSNYKFLPGNKEAIEMAMKMREKM